MKRISVATDGGTLDLEIDATAFVKLENRAKAAGCSTADYISLFLASEVQRTHKRPKAS